MKLRRWRSGRWFSHSLPFFLQAVLLGFAAQSDSESLWLTAFVLTALINLWAWIFALGRRRAILDTPTSRVASAAQGYVELIGNGQPMADTQLVSPLAQLPCLWYRYTLERHEDGDWRQVEEGESDLPFNLDDGSGQCEIDPQGAEILTTHQETRTEGDHRTTEHVLLKGDRLYALGEFSSVNGVPARFDARRDVGDLLAEWKSDQPELHRRFDLDGDGALDDQEWQLARQVAQREVATRHREIRDQPIRHYLRKPALGKPFLISNHPPERLGRRYGWLSAVHLALLVGSLFGIGWAINLPG